MGIFFGRKKELEEIQKVIKTLEPIIAAAFQPRHHRADFIWVNVMGEASESGAYEPCAAFARLIRPSEIMEVSDTEDGVKIDLGEDREIYIEESFEVMAAQLGVATAIRVPHE